MCKSYIAHAEKGAFDNAQTLTPQALLIPLPPPPTPTPPAPPPGKGSFTSNDYEYQRKQNHESEQTIFIQQEKAMVELSPIVMKSKDRQPKQFPRFMAVP